MKNPGKDSCWPENVLCLLTVTHKTHLWFIPRLRGGAEGTRCWSSMRTPGQDRDHPSPHPVYITFIFINSASWLKWPQLKKKERPRVEFFFPQYLHKPSHIYQIISTWQTGCLILRTPAAMMVKGQVLVKASYPPCWIMRLRIRLMIEFLSIKSPINVI
jgi:hypothetical protein